MPMGRERSREMRRRVLRLALANGVPWSKLKDRGASRAMEREGGKGVWDRAGSLSVLKLQKSLLVGER